MRKARSTSLGLSRTSNMHFYLRAGLIELSIYLIVWNGPEEVARKEPEGREGFVWSRGIV